METKNLIGVSRGLPINQLINMTVFLLKKNCHVYLCFNKKPKEIKSKPGETKKKHEINEKTIYSYSINIARKADNHEEEKLINQSVDNCNIITEMIKAIMPSHNKFDKSKLSKIGLKNSDIDKWVKEIYRMFSEIKQKEVKK